MKREMDLIRALMLKLEAREMRPGQIAVIQASDNEVQVDGYTPVQIDYHLTLLKEIDFIYAPGNGVMRGHTFQRLTYAGHDFVDSVRSDDVWNKTKKGVEEAGGFTLDLLKDLAKGFIRKQIADKTGVEI